MSELRLILLVAGVVLLLVVYLLSKRVERKSTARNSPRREPSFEMFVSESDAVPQPRMAVADPANSPDPTLFEQGDLPLPEELRPEPDLPADKQSTDSPQSVEAGNEKVIVMHVTAKSGNRFRGPAIVDALAAESLEFGDFNIFHRRSGGRSLYSVASMVEPGQFDMDSLESFTTPGLSMFLVLPGPDSPVATFTEMLSTARRLATTLGGEVLDESGSTLSRQAASHLREQIIDFAHRIR